MNRPTQPEDQCPSCHFQSVGPICGGQRRRLNKNEKDEYFKAIDCPLWTERRIVQGPAGEKRCPTCGQVIPNIPVTIVPRPAPSVQSPTTSCSLPPTVIPDPFDWGDSVSEPECPKEPSELTKKLYDATILGPVPPEAPTATGAKRGPKPGRQKAMDSIPKARHKKEVIS